MSNEADPEPIEEEKTDEASAPEDEPDTEPPDEVAPADADGDDPADSSDDDPLPADLPDVDAEDLPEDADPGDERLWQVAILERRLEERQLGLDKRSETLDDREEELEAWDTELEARQETLDDRHRELQERTASLDERADTLDERERSLEEFEAELSDRADRISEDEETLHRYMERQVGDFEDRVHTAVGTALEEWDTGRYPSRYSQSRNVTLGLIGLTMIAGGILYGSWLQFGAASGFFGSMFADIALISSLMIIGLTLNVLSTIRNL